MYVECRKWLLMQVLAVHVFIYILLVGINSVYNISVGVVSSCILRTFKGMLGWHVSNGSVPTPLNTLALALTS